MKIIEDKVYVENLTIPEVGLSIPPCNFHKVLYIDTQVYYIEINHKVIKARKDDYLVVEKDRLIKINLASETEEQGNITLVYIDDNYINELSSEESNLELCFIEAKNTDVRLVQASSEVYMLIKALTRRLIGYEKIEGFARTEILESTLIILLSFANRGYIESKLNKKRSHKRLDIIDDIFIYINKHIEEPITLDDLEKEFFMSKFHLLKIFKDTTNMTIHSYIVKRKLSFAKELIEHNMPIVQVYVKCGFSNYSHFFRAFKKEYGMTPKAYYKKSKLT